MVSPFSKPEAAAARFSPLSVCKICGYLKRKGKSVTPFTPDSKVYDSILLSAPRQPEHGNRKECPGQGTPDDSNM